MQKPVEEYKKRQAMIPYRDEGDNTVAVDDEDVARAEANIVRPLIRGKSSSSLVEPKSCHDRRSYLLTEVLANFIQEVVLDKAPVVVDYGCALGASMASLHRDALLVCVHSTSDEADRHDLANVVSVWTSKDGDYLAPPFSNFYDVCNFYSAAVMLYPLFQSTPLDRLMDHFAIVAGSTAVVIGAFPVAPNDACEELTEAVYKNALVKGSEVQVSCELLGAVTVGSSTFALVRVVQSRSTRPCRKTWGAPFIQWERSQKVIFDEGRVKFLVSTSSNGAKAVALRSVHPLQYIHSVNLDTLLGAGLTERQRVHLLGQMLRTPRYSDPLPHNWVLSGSGELRRIDKVDLRYDSKVNERLNYWGVSTRGYMRLLATHLCLPVGKDGLAAVIPLVLNQTCHRQCIHCACNCSYLPKGSRPCTACMSCGDCLLDQRGTLNNRRASAKFCQKTYSTMDKARREWKTWERADAKGSTKQCTG